VTKATRNFLALAPIGHTQIVRIKIPVKVSSADKDGSENITKIVISGVPQGVTVVLEMLN
jgi:hypothetical protein